MFRDVDDDNLENRRKHPRAPIELRVEYKRLNSFFADYTKNISHGGTFICTERPLPIGTEFVFNLGVPNLENPLVLKGKVHWIVMPQDATEERVAGMGIGFIYESEADRQSVEREVERLMVDSFGQGLYDRLIGNRLKER
jgi:type IV pilus assembly protein PilZ